MPNTLCPRVGHFPPLNGSFWTPSNCDALTCFASGSGCPSGNWRDATAPIIANADEPIILVNAGANKGYAVFQPHFRGGSGTGRKWVEAGWGQWGQLIQSDINDGTRAMIARGIADPNRICVAGWSHGGYVAFTASYLDTDLYKCSMAGAGVSDLRRMQDWVRDEQGGRQSISYKYWANAIGDPNDDKGKLDAYSARRNAEQVGMPLLIMHGAVWLPIRQWLQSLV